MKKIYKNIPAFPTQELNSNYGTHPMQDGMTLRDYFAGQAIMGLSAVIDWPENIAQSAYKIADAMMQERDK